MQQNNANNKKIIKNKMISFVAHKFSKTYKVIDSKIEILDTMTTFSIAWQFESITQIES